MNLAGLLGYMDEALDMGAATESSGFVALVRVPEVPFGSEESWRQIPIVGLQVDDGDVDVILDERASEPMSVAQLRDWAASLPVGSLEYNLFVPGPYEPVVDDWEVRRDVPVAAAVFNPDEQLFGIMPWYEEYETELGPLNGRSPSEAD